MSCNSAAYQHHCVPSSFVPQLVLLDSIDGSQGGSSEEVAVSTFWQEINFQLSGSCFLRSLVLG